MAMNWPTNAGRFPGKHSGVFTSTSSKCWDSINFVDVLLCVNKDKKVKSGSTTVGNYSTVFPASGTVHITFTAFLR